MKLSRKKRILVFLLALLTAAAVMPVPALAAEDVTYLKRSWNSETNTITESYETVTEPLKSFPGECEGGGWFFIGADKTCNDRVTLPASAVVNLILADGVTLDCKNGIFVSPTATLNVYGQHDGSGVLKATGSSGNAGVGGNEAGSHGGINLYGGTVIATGGSHGTGIGTGEDAEGECGAIRIYGGDVTAKGGEYGAGIGGGDESTGARIEIYGGSITAEGGDEAAGIGGGCDRGPISVTIRGGNISATGGKYGAGIGEGYDATTATSSGKVFIYGCERVTGIGGFLAAGIGGGFYNNTKMEITISGGDQISAYGSPGNDCGAAGIGAGSYSSISGVLSGGGDFGGSITISGGNVTALGTGTYASLLGVNSGAAGLGAGFGGNMTGAITVSGGTVRASGEYGGAAIGAGAEEKFGNGGECEGTVKITGGALELWCVNNSVDDKAVLIGHGCDGDENGTLTLGPHMRVTQGATPVAAGQRDSVCHSDTAYHVFIEECQHENALYAQNNELTHILSCKNCLYRTEEEHFFFEGACDCGAEGFGVFFFDEGELYDTRMSYGHGGTVTPPDAPEAKGYHFGGWCESTDGKPGEPYDFSAPIESDLFLQAHWQVLAGLMTYNRTTKGFISGGKVRLGYEGAFTLTTNRIFEIGDFVQAECMPNEGYDFVGWSLPEEPEKILIETDAFGFRVSRETIYCAVFEKHEHDMRFISGYPARCESDGEIDHYKCRKCRKLFLDEEGFNEISEDDTVIPAIPHDWDAPTYTWAEDYSELTAVLVCRNDPSHVEEETVESASVVSKEATCTGKGETTYTSAHFENEAFEAQSVTVADIEAKGHAYGEPVWTWAEDHSTATATFACKQGDDTQTVTQDATEAEVSAATATEDRMVKYTVSVEFNGRTYTTESENIVVPGTATGEPDTPDKPSQDDNICKWDNVDHGTSFWGRLVKFFHTILYFFAHLFGRR